MNRSDITRRSALGLIGAGAVAGTGLGLPGLARAQTRPFTWAATGGTWGGTIGDVFVAPFAEASGIDPQHSAQLESVAAAKLLASCGNPPYDVSNCAQADAVLLANSGCLAPYDTDIVTSLGDLHAGAMEGDFYAAFNILLFGMTWNTKEATKPASFEDLLQEKYRNRIGVPAYGWYGMTWLHALNKELGGTEDDIGPGIAAAAEMVQKQNAIIVENADHGTRLMESGEVVIMPYWNGRTARLQQAGIPAAFEIVPGTVSVGSGFSIAAGSPYPDAAQALVQSTLDPERQLQFTMWSKYPPSNATVELPSELEGIRIAPGALDVAAKLDWQKINAYRSEYLERWNKEVLAG